MTPNIIISFIINYRLLLFSDINLLRTSHYWLVMKSVYQRDVDCVKCGVLKHIM